MALKPGLTEFLLREPLEQIVETPIKNVHVLSAGTIPPNPVELITSKTFDTFLDMVRDKYTRVIIDTPPVLGLADAVIAGAKADGVLLVVSAGKVSKDALRQCVKRLRAVYAPMVGCILNSVDITSSEYGEYSRYYYSYKQEDEESNVLRMRRSSKSDRKAS